MHGSRCRLCIDQAFSELSKTFASAALRIHGPASACARQIDLPGSGAATVTLTSFGISRAQVAKKTAGLVLAVLTIVSRPSSDQTSARSRRRPAENAWRVPTGRPFKLPDWPGSHWVGLLTSVMFDTCFHLIIMPSSSPSWEALGLTIPPTLLATADDVIE